MFSRSYRDTPIFYYMESRAWGQCKHCRKLGDTFRISQNRQERLCKECSQQHAPWIDATVMEMTSNPSDSDSPETEDSGQEGRTGAGWYASDLQSSDTRRARAARPLKRMHCLQTVIISECGGQCLGDTLLYIMIFAAFCA